MTIASEAAIWQKVFATAGIPRIHIDNTNLLIKVNQDSRIKLAGIESAV